MEAILLGTQQQNQYTANGQSRISDPFDSLPSHGFRSLNCRSFYSGTGIILRSPARTSSCHETITPSCYSEPPKSSKRSRAIDIVSAPSLKENDFNDDIACIELFAGPVFSNSPPPSSLPIPKFSLRQKRSNSLELPVSKSEVVPALYTRSAPSSPTTKGSCSSSVFDTSMATENLRRILHLDLTD